MIIEFVIVEFLNNFQLNLNDFHEDIILIYKLYQCSFTIEEKIRN
jgi:hypothetical protein